MTGMVLGRPTSPTSRPVTEVGLTIIIMFAIVTIPFVAAKAVRLYVETLELTVFKGDAAAPHIIVTGDVTEARVRAFLAQLYHESRRFAIQIGPRVVILSPNGSTAGLLELIDQTRFGGNITFIKGSPLNQGDLARASATTASTMLFLTSRLEPAGTTDAITLAACLSAKNYNPSLRLLVQLRQQRAQQQIATIPAWSQEDRSIVLPNFTHTLLGVGALVPGLPALVAMLIQQGSGTAAEKALKQRHGSSWGAMSSQLAFTGTEHPQDAVMGGSSSSRPRAALWPVDVMQQVCCVLNDHSPMEDWAIARAPATSNDVFQVQRTDSGTPSSAPCCRRPHPPAHSPPRAVPIAPDARDKLLLGTGAVIDERGVTVHVEIAGAGAEQGMPAAVSQVRQPWRMAIGKSPLQEFAAGFSQELHEVRLTPGLAFRSFGAAARMVYLRYHILLLAARVRSGRQKAASTRYIVPQGGQTSGVGSQRPSKPSFDTDVRLFPCKLLLDPSAVVSLYAVAPSEEAVARLQQDTGSDWLRVIRYANASLQLGVAPSQNAPPLPCEPTGNTETSKVSWRSDREKILLASSWLFHWFGLPHAYARALAAAEFDLASPWPWLRMTDSHIHPRKVLISRPLCYGSCCWSLCCKRCLAASRRGSDEATVWNNRGSHVVTKDGSPRPVSASMALYSARSGAPSMHRGVIQIVPPLALSDAASLPHQYKRTKLNSTAHTTLGGAHDPDEVDVIGLSQSLSSDVLSAFSGGSAGAASAPTHRQLGANKQEPHDGGNVVANAQDKHKRRGSVTNSMVGSPAPRRSRLRASSITSAGAGGVAGIGGSVTTLNKAAVTAAPNALRDHILICGANINMGLLLRSLRSVPYDPPFCTHRVFLKPPSQGGTAESLLGRGTSLEAAAEVEGDEGSVVSFTSAAPGGSNTPAQLHWKVVVLCPNSHRPDFASAAKLDGSNSSWLSQVQWIDGSPLALEDLVRAGALAARAAIVLANDGGFRGGGAGSSPLLDDVDAISVASGLYKLNPALHIVTQLQHGSSATFLRPSGSSLSSAEEFTTDYVSQLTQQIQNASEKFAKQIAQQKARRAMAESALASGSMAGSVPPPSAAAHSTPGKNASIHSPVEKQETGLVSQSSAPAAHHRHVSIMQDTDAIPEAAESDERDSDEEAVAQATTRGAAAGAGLALAGMPLAGTVVGSSLAATQDMLRSVQADRRRADASDSSDSDVCSVARDEQAADVYSISSDSDASPAEAAIQDAEAAMESPTRPEQAAQSPSQHKKAHRRGWSLLRALVQEGKQTALQPAMASPTQAKAVMEQQPSPGASSSKGGSNATESNERNAAQDEEENARSSLEHESKQTDATIPAVAPVSAAGILGALSDVVTSGALEAPQVHNKAPEREESTPMQEQDASAPGSALSALQQPDHEPHGKPPMVPSTTEQKQVLRDIVKLAAKTSTAEAIGSQLLEQHLQSEEQRTRELEMMALGIAESDASGPASANAPVQIAQQASPAAGDGREYAAPAHRGSLTAQDLKEASPPWGIQTEGSEGTRSVSESLHSVSPALAPASSPVHDNSSQELNSEHKSQDILPNAIQHDNADLAVGLEEFPFTKLFQSENATCEVVDCPHLALETCAAQTCDTHVLSGAMAEASSIASRANASSETCQVIRAHLAGYAPFVGAQTSRRPSARPTQPADPSDASFKELDENMNSGNESIGDKLFTSKTSQQARRAARAAAEADLFGAPAFAAGRAFSATTLDALVVESFYTPHAISLVKRLVRASRKQRLQLVPAQEALFMVRWFCPSFTTLQQAVPVSQTSNSASKLPPSHWPIECQQWPLIRYGQLSEALLRGWHLLSLGLYRRRSPAATQEIAHQSSVSSAGSPTLEQQAADLLQAQLPSTDGPFRHSRELISYVYTNPPPHTILTPYDYIYVLRAHGEER